MQGSFEKKVQEKLDELTLTPAAPVWEKIEAQIVPEKGRRRGLFWLPLGLLLLAGGGWWLWTGTKGEEGAAAKMDVETVRAATPKNAGSPEKTTRPTPLEKSIKKESTLPLQVKPSSAEIGNTAAAVKITGSNQLLSYHAALSPSIVKKAKRYQSSASGVLLPSAEKMTLDRVGKSGINNAAVVEEEKNETSTSTVFGNKIPERAIKEDASAGQKETIAPVDTAAKTNLPAEEKTPAVTAKDSVATKRKIAAGRKWKWNVTAQVTRSGPLLTQSDIFRDAYASPVQNNTGGLYTGQLGRNTISGTTGYTVGAGFTRDITKRLQLSTGLQYASYRSRTRVGSFRTFDTSLQFRRQSVSVDGYYTNGQQQEYTIRQHVLELPVSIGYQPLRSVPLQLTAGASYGRLLKSNALTFNQSGNFYYKNNKNILRHQVALFSSLQYGFLNKKTFGLSAGPVVQYQLSSFQKETGPAKPRLLFAGIKISLNF